MQSLKRFPLGDIQKNSELYDKYIHDYKMHNGWLPGNQMYNFKALIRIAELAEFPLKGSSVLDVGCGTGDFSAFLRKKKIKEYLGIDIYEPSLKQAKKTYPHEKFLSGDLLSMDISQTFDFAFASGTFTINLSVNNYDFLQAMLEKIWSLTRIGLAFNVLTEDDDYLDPDLFFYNPDDVLQRCFEVAPDASISAEKTPYISQIHVYMHRENLKH